MDANKDVPSPSLKEAGVNSLTSIRDGAITDVQKAQRKDAHLEYQVSPHFITLYRDPTIYSRFGLEPSSLNETLERSLESACNFFGIETPEELHVIDIGKGERFLGIRMESGPFIGRGHVINPLGGLWRPEKNSVFGIRYRPGMDFSEVIADTSFDRAGNPKFIGSAIRYGVAESVLSKLMTAWSEEWANIGFVREGLAYYIQYSSQGIDPDDVMKMVMGDYVMQPERFGDWEGQIKESITPAKARQLVSKRDYFTGDISIEEVFRIEVLEYAKKPKIALWKGETGYYRGASFVKFLINKLGIERFKTLLEGANSRTFRERLLKTTGLTIERIEQEWKDRVVGNFEHNPLLDTRERAKPQLPKIPRDKVKQIYQENA